MIMAKKETKSFEESTARLGEIVTLLEKGEASLEESIKLFEEGTKLAVYCEELLQKAEQRVVMLTRGTGDEIGEQDFDAGEA